MWSTRKRNHKRSTQKFPCSYCEKVFARHGGLIGHLRVHTGERPHQCQMCGKRFSDSSSLTKHIRTHTGEKPFLCNFCNRAFSISHNLTRHLKLHTKECKNVVSKVQIPDSGGCSSAKAKRSYVCSKCSAVCQSLKELNKHLQKMHAKWPHKASTIISTKIGIEKQNYLANSNSSITKNKITQSANLASFTDFQSLGHKEFCLQEELKQNIGLSAEDSQLPAKENLFLLMPNNDNLDSPTHSVFDQNWLAASSSIESHSQNNQIESLLPKKTQEKQPAFLNSKRTESSETIPMIVTPFTNSASNLNTSDQLLHDLLGNTTPGPNNDAFQESRKKSIRPNNKISMTLRTDNNGKIKHHNKRISPLQFQYRREECSKESSSLKRGKTGHNAKTLPIENVQKTASLNTESSLTQCRPLGVLSEPKITLSTNIQKHAIHHHSLHRQKLLSGPNLRQDSSQTLNPRILQTKSQPKGFRNKPARNGEMKYPCLYCDKVFTRLGGLVGHTRVHTGEKPHKCQTCGKRFSDSSSLTKHIRTHTGEKPFQCKLCRRAFSISHNLTRHLKLHSKDKLHSREGSHFTKPLPAGTIARAALRIHSNSKSPEKRINKFRSSSHGTLRKPSLGQTNSETSTMIDNTFDGQAEPSSISTVGSADDRQILRGETFQSVVDNLTQFDRKDIHGYPASVSDQELSKEDAMPENDIKPILTNLSSWRMQGVTSNVDKEESILTWCPSGENNYFAKSNEYFEQYTSVPSLVNNSVKNFEEQHEPNETSKSGSIINSSDVAISASSSLNCNQNPSVGIVSKNNINNVESQPKIEPSWFDACGSTNNQGIESERVSLLFNNQCQQPATPAARKDVNTLTDDGWERSSNTEFPVKSDSLLHPLGQNKHEAPLDGKTKPANTSQVYRCGYCPEQFSDMKVLSEHIQVHNKKSQITFARKSGANKIDHPQNDFPESFSETHISKKTIDFTLEDKNIQNSSEPEGTEPALNSDTLSPIPQNTEKQQTETSNAKHSSNISSTLSDLKTVRPSRNPTKTLNFPPLQNSQIQIPQTKTLVNGTKFKFRCPYCVKVFNRHGGLIGHMRVHTGEKPYECQTCGKRFSDSSSLTKHIRTHTGEKPFTCPICYRAFSISHNLTRHLKLHGREKQRGGRLIRCRYCWATFQSLRVLKSHLRYHSFTSKAFKAGRKNLVGNCKKRISDATNPVGGKTEIFKDNNKEIPALPFQENISANISNKKKQLPLISRIHNKISKNRNYSLSVSDSSHLSEKNVNRGTNLKGFPKGSLWSTSSIGMTFEPPEEMENNEGGSDSLGATKESSDVPTLSWNNNSVPSTESLPKFTVQLQQIYPAFPKDEGGTELVAQSAQIKEANEESEPRILLKSCQTNNEANMTSDSELTDTSQNLKDFLRERKPFSSVDTDETDINENGSKQLCPNYSRNSGKEIEIDPKAPTSVSKCGYCHKSFRDFSSLSKHMSVHKEQKSRHQNSSKLNSDAISLLHSRSPSKKFKLLRLGSEQTKPWLSLNKKDARIYHCPFCTKQFTRHGGLVGHLRVHTGEKPHECQTCNKRFSDSSSLTKHIRTHTGEKPFHCKLCHRAFSISHNLTRHLKLHSRESQKSSTRARVPSFRSLSNSDGSPSSSVNFEANPCKEGTPGPLPNLCQSYHNKTSIIDRQLHKIHNSISPPSDPTLSSDYKFEAHQQNINPENISSHMTPCSQSVPGIITDHFLGVIPANDLSSNQLLGVQEISLRLKPQFLSPPNNESNIPNKTPISSVTPLSDPVSQILQPVTNNHLPPAAKKTPNFSSEAKVKSAHLVSCNENAVKSCNEQTSQNSFTKNESQNQTNTFSDAFSKTFLLLKSLSSYNSAEITELHPKASPQTNNLQPGPSPNSHSEIPNPNTSIPSPSNLCIEPSVNKTISESFLSPIEPLRILSSNENDTISIETVLSGVTESLTGEQDCPISVDNEFFNSPYTFQKDQTLSNISQTHGNNQTLTHNSSSSFPRPQQKTLIDRNTCILCRTSFPNFQSLEAHLKIHRTQDKTFTCGCCGRNFARFSGLMGHARTHTLERPYVCSICQRAFSDSSSLTKHTRIHTGEKPFTCKYCSRAFSISHNLTRHLKLHSKEKNKPP